MNEKTGGHFVRKTKKGNLSKILLCRLDILRAHQSAHFRLQNAL